ncbi:Lrp/AsnC family transcriptional regulator [Trinickia sp. NRRL B-1857]|uniref:Lrp/AsnC family transcriptional regulator n=1 Tax=Trinickia sp. NRRL B-1857 TaxID=3162879 RepID=UPI003D289E5B
MSTKRPKVEMDTVDRSMLRMLQDDGSLSNAALREKLSLSVTPCWRRREHLEDESVITGYHANIDRRAIGLDLRRQAGVAWIQSSLTLREVKAASQLPIPDEN